MSSARLAPPLLLPRRKQDSHKGDYGRVLFVGGARGMAGSISLSAMAAMRCGSGLVTVMTPDRCVDTVASFDPCLMTLAAPDNGLGQFDTAAMDMLEKHAIKADAIGIGPGMNTGAGSIALVTLACCMNKVPRVLDADALNILATSSDDHKMEGPAVLTPHPGEMQRLCGVSAADRDGQIESAVSLAAELGMVILLKGNRSFITDGHERWFNDNGNPGMAKGGSGDCLTGIITSLLGQGLAPLDATKLGAYVHGLAGDLAAAELGEAGMMPTDLIRFIPQAIQAVTSNH